ncbi:thioredoxin [bacterium]|nr:thioredoxin [bacterium]
MKMLELNNEDFNEEIKDKLVLVDFYATWCGPCRMMHPIIEEVAKEENIKVIKVDVDKHDELARNYGIMSIPTIILFQNGNLVEKNIGFIPKEQLLTMIKNYK